MFLRLKKVTTINSTSIDPAGRVYATDERLYEEFIVNPDHIISVKEVIIDGESYSKLNTIKGDYLVVGSPESFLSINSSVDSPVDESSVSNKKLLKG